MAAPSLRMTDQLFQYGKFVAYRYRCNACGNLTRFDVVETTSVRSFHHYSVGGDLSIEEPEIIAHSVESVTCRWCGHGRGVEVLTESE
jgi:hypothetical protein